MEKTILNLCRCAELNTLLAASSGEYILINGVCRDGAITPHAFDNLFLVTCDDHDSLAAIRAEIRLSSSVPLLFFHHENAAPPPVHASRFIDALAWPCSKAMLHHKLDFLRHLSRFCRQREIFIKTNDALIDSLSRRDGLTGLYNRRHLLRQLEDELQKARARAGNLSLIILDPDNFRHINQSHGYTFGDNLLGELSARVSGAARDEGGICCRYCGASFAVILLGANSDEAARCAERIRMACCGKSFRRHRQTIHIGLSMGIASLGENQPENSDQFITMTETALYQAKSDGRNRIRVFSKDMGQRDISSGRGVSTLKSTINALLQNTRATTISSLMSLTNDMGGDEQRRHSALVGRYLGLLVKDMALPTTLLKVFENTTNLLTCVRVLLRQDILARSGEFTDDERRLMRELPYKTAELTENFDFFLMERTLLLTQGECYDGSGAPHGLKGDEIPFTARLFKLVDAFAAMTADRPHRDRLLARVVVNELVEQAGLQFDPTLVLRLFAAIKRHNLLRIEAEILAEARRQLLERFPDIETETTRQD
ncbi:MAG: diguanylate cyclase [Desulfobulbaceae bacterium]|jgi:diguanylate cyclase (GGDEF)-like protein|nr:diguanylate cyclase [Desulfobulbaceae bacterium]